MSNLANDEEISPAQLLTILEVMVPLYIDQYRHLSYKVTQERAWQLAQTLCVEGMYVVVKQAKTTERGRPANAINKTAQALALLACHQPEGVLFAGVRFTINGIRQN